MTIQRPVGAVFAFVADGLNGPQWRPGILDIALASGSGRGAVYRQGVKGPGGRRVAADYEITAYEPD
ncbi:MAG: SRPBCC family protein, partial [Candidatus Limnocylindrales bacterium]